MKPRFKKVFRDLTSNKGRTLLVVLAIAVGVFSFGGVFITQDVLLKNLEDQYISSNASNVSLYMSDFDSSLVEWAKTQDGVANASGKANQGAKLVFSNGAEENISLLSVPDFTNLTLNLVVPKRGSWPPKRGELILERGSLA